MGLGTGRGGSPRPAGVRALVVLVGLNALAACGEDGATGPAGAPARLAEVSGDDQSWYFSNPLPAPYEVVALDANGVGVPGVEVTWTVTSGGGTVEPAVSTTGSGGVATTTHTLGPSETTQAVTASATGLADVQFVATASDPPTSGAVTVGDNFFSPRDVVVQVGGTVTWTWAGLFAHNVIFVGGPAPRPADSPTQDSGTYDVTFTTPALHPYVCTLHSEMSGTVRVVH